jgi:type VI secretion system protein
LTACALLAGCAMFSNEPKPTRLDWNRLTLAAAVDANDNSALAVDVVLVRDKALLDKLLAMPASAYFSARGDLQSSFPDGLTVFRYEITPGLKIDVDRKRLGADKVWAALVFANYATPGEHRQRLPLTGSGYLLELNVQDLVARDSKSGAALPTRTD